MSYIIKDRNGNPRTHQGQNLLGSDATETVVKDISVARRSFTICASSSNTDLMGDIVEQGGIDFTLFNNNPCILWAHRAEQIPIGRCVEHFQERSNGTVRTMMRIQLSEAEDSLKIFDAVRNGFLKCASIGFIARKTEPIKSGKDEDKPAFGNPTRYLKSTLLETSIVSIGANQDAMMALRSMASRGELPGYCVDCADIDVEGLLNDMKLDKILAALDDIDDDDCEGCGGDDELDLDLSDEEIRELIKVAIREALGRLP